VKISESVVNSVVSKSKSSGGVSSSGVTSGGGTGGHSPRLNDAQSGGNKQRHDSKEEYQPGICTIVDMKKLLLNNKTSTSGSNSSSSSSNKRLHDESQTWIVAHFLAHQEPIYALEFNPNGRLLVSADSLGQYFNVFLVSPSPVKSTRAHVKHVYSLYRGDTSSKVRHIAFSNDSRWLAVGTKRGTTHLFPINVYGGPVNARTHSKPYVVNRVSKHHRTAGFIDHDDMMTLNVLSPHSNYLKLNG
jgi:WD40 repeat protein